MRAVKPANKAGLAAAEWLAQWAGTEGNGGQPRTRRTQRCGSELHRDAVADQAFVDAQCLKIRLDPGHLARPSLFLAADDANGFTGQHVLVDAGIARQSVIG
jgi:hypothetical protein